MNIKGVGVNNVINLYNSNSVKKVEKTEEVRRNDSIEISSLAKALSNFDVAEVGADKAKIEELTEKIANGTYNVDAKLTAESIMNHIKESR